MNSHYPVFRVGAAQGLVPKLGGLPWGLPARLWPICKECERPMSHLAQLPADAAALAVNEDEVLFLFKCEWDSVCSFWDHDGGANAAFTVPRTALGDSPTAAPVAGDEGPPVELPELGITQWKAADDGAPPQMEDDFYDYGRHNALPDDIAHPHDWAGAWRTKSGGVPYWTANGAQGMPPGRLLLQIDNWVEVDGANVEVANFCSDGTAYVFVDRAQTPPTYSLFINR